MCNSSSNGCIVQSRLCGSVALSTCNNLRLKSNGFARVGCTVRAERKMPTLARRLREEGAYKF